MCLLSGASLPGRDLKQCIYVDENSKHKEVNLPLGQIIYQRSICSVYSLRHRQIETTYYTVFSSQPKVGSDIRANHCPLCLSSLRRSRTVKLIFIFYLSSFFIYLIYISYTFIHLSLFYLFIIFRHPPSVSSFYIHSQWKSPYWYIDLVLETAKSEHDGMLPVSHKCISNRGKKNSCHIVHVFRTMAV